MRTIFFLLLLVCIVLGGLYIKRKVSKTGKSVEVEIPESGNIATRWDSILPGKWKIIDIGSNTDERWENEADIEFFGDHQFSLNATENYYNLNSFSGGPALDLITGGGATGKWYATSDSNFTLLSKDCYFNVSKGERLDRDKIRLFKCNDGDGLQITYGMISWLSFKSQINTLNKDSILITGKSYSGSYDVVCQFIRQ